MKGIRPTKPSPSNRSPRVQRSQVEVGGNDNNDITSHLINTLSSSPVKLHRLISKSHVAAKINTRKKPRKFQKYHDMLSSLHKEYKGLYLDKAARDEVIRQLCYMNYIDDEDSQSYLMSGENESDDGSSAGGTIQHVSLRQIRLRMEAIQLYLNRSEPPQVIYTARIGAGEEDRQRVRETNIERAVAIFVERKQKKDEEDSNMMQAYLKDTVSMHNQLVRRVAVGYISRVVTKGKSLVMQRMEVEQEQRRLLALQQARAVRLIVKCWRLSRKRFILNNINRLINEEKDQMMRIMLREEESFRRVVEERYFHEQWELKKHRQREEMFRERQENADRQYESRPWFRRSNVTRKSQLSSQAREDAPSSYCSLPISNDVVATPQEKEKLPQRTEVNSKDRSRKQDKSAVASVPVHLKLSSTIPSTSRSNLSSDVRELDQAALEFHRPDMAPFSTMINSLDPAHVPNFESPENVRNKASASGNQNDDEWFQKAMVGPQYRQTSRRGDKLTSSVPAQPQPQPLSGVFKVLDKINKQMDEGSAQMPQSGARDPYWTNFFRFQT